MVGVDPALMSTMIAIESNFRPGVKAGTSSATGLGQFISSTWTEMLEKYGAKYGIAPGTPPTDARANALMTAEFLKANGSYLERKLGRKPTDNDLYLAHFLGVGGAETFLKAAPGQIAARIMPSAAASNRPIFYNENGSARTIAEVYQEIDRRVSSRGRTYGSAMAAMAQGQNVKVTEPTKLADDVAVNDPNFTPAGAGIDLDQGKPKAKDTPPTSGGIPFAPLQQPTTPAATAPATQPAVSGVPSGLARPIGMDDPSTAASITKVTKPNASDAVYRQTQQQQIQASAGGQLQRQVLERNVSKVQSGQMQVFESIAGSVSSMDGKMTTLIEEVRKLQLVGGTTTEKPKAAPAAKRKSEIPVDTRPLPVKMR